MIAIKHNGTGEIQYVSAIAGYGAGWSQFGPVLPAGVDPGNLILVAGTWVEDPANVEAILLTAIKAEAERRKMAFLSPGGAKSTEYSDQAAEVRFFWSLGGTTTAVLGLIGVWSPARRAAVFPCATANAAEFGDTIDKAIARFSAGMARSAEKEAIAAVEAKVCAAIKAATTASAKRAIAAAVTWPA